jgi:hypothetical protein
MSVDLECLVLAGSTLVALGAIGVVPRWYERYLARRRDSRVLGKLLRMGSGDLPRVSRRVRARTTSAARTEAAASPTPPDSGLAAAPPKHRRAD